MTQPAPTVPEVPVDPLDADVLDMKAKRDAFASAKAKADSSTAALSAAKDKAVADVAAAQAAAQQSLAFVQQQADQDQAAEHAAHIAFSQSVSKVIGDVNAEDPAPAA